MTKEEVRSAFDDVIKRIVDSTSILLEGLTVQVGIHIVFLLI